MSHDTAWGTMLRVVGTALGVAILAGGGLALDQAPPPQPAGATREAETAEALLARIRQDRPAGEVDVSARRQAACEALSSGRFAEALDELTWLWLHCLDYDPSYVGVRGSYLVSDMAKLVAAYPPARAPFSLLRDEQLELLRGPAPSREALDELQSLNRMLGEDDSTARWLLAAVGRPEARNAALLGAVERGETATVRALLVAGAEVDFDGENRTPLGTAAIYGPPEMVDLVLDAGAAVDKPGRGGQTALHLAAYGADLEVVERLLARGASPNARDHEGRTPADLARLAADIGRKHAGSSCARDSVVRLEAVVARLDRAARLSAGTPTTP